MELLAKVAYTDPIKSGMGSIFGDMHCTLLYIQSSSGIATPDYRVLVLVYMFHYLNMKLVAAGNLEYCRSRIHGYTDYGR